MRTITLDQVMALSPCYTRRKILRLTDGRKEIPLTEVLDVPAPLLDICWLILHEPFLTANEMQLFACDTAEYLLTRERDAGHEPDPRSWAAVAAKRAWLRGDLDDLGLTAAGAAAWAVARDDSPNAPWRTSFATGFRFTAWEAARAAALSTAWVPAKRPTLNAAEFAIGNLAKIAPDAGMNAWVKQRLRELIGETEHVATDTP